MCNITYHLRFNVTSTKLGNIDDEDDEFWGLQLHSWYFRDISVFNIEEHVIVIMCKLFPKYEKNEFIFCKVVFGLEKNNELYLLVHPGLKLPPPPRVPSPATPPSPPTAAPEGGFPNIIML